MAIQIGKYKRPGIFLEESDNSVISTPVVTGVSSLVVGFSKKGPINAPVLLQTISDLEKIYGPLDRNLERKGSYFYRTISKMLESSPVYAMNLLATSDILDKIEYKSVSTATDKLNDVEREGAYRKFFDTTGFWKRDTDSFINLTRTDTGFDDRLLSFTNMSDKYITIFVFKSKLKGFDQTLLTWYGSSDKVPTYVSEYDFASDYMVDVIVVGGDWSNYQQLSVDTKWSNYFTSQGLIKEQIYNFSNDRNVNLLNFYEGLSLIPFFRDSNGNNIFIETVINRDTDKTGLFCAFDSDKFEKDFPTGMIDLIGNNLVTSEGLLNNGQADIDFLSYNITITEKLDFTSTPLDVAGGTDGQNLVAFGPSFSAMVGGTGSMGYLGNNNRTAYYSEGLVNGAQYSTYSAYTNITGTNSLQVGFTLTDTPHYDLLGTPTYSYAIIGGEKVLINGGTSGTFTFSVAASEFETNLATASYTSVFYVDSSDGTITLKTSTVDGIAPTIGASDVVLGYMDYYVYNGLISQSVSPVYTHVGVTGSGPNPLKYNTDFTVTDLGSGSIKVEFLNTANVDVTNNYKSHRKIRLFNFLVNMLDSSNLKEMTMIKSLTTFEKLSLKNAAISNIVTSSTSNKSFNLYLGVSSVPTDIAAGNLIFYKIDNEFVLGVNGVNTTSEVGATYGVVGEYSTFYSRFYNGQINTGDYFYTNITDDSLRVTFQNEGTQSYVVFSENPWSGGVIGNEQILVPSSTLNTGVVTLISSTNFRTSLVDPASGVTYSNGYLAYKVSNTLVDEDLEDVTAIYNSTLKVYLQMYLDSSGNLKVKFVDSTLATIEPIDVDLNSTFTVVSNKSNYKQSVEIESSPGYTPVVNKILINGSRYTEVKVGDFLEAYVDPNIVLETGEVSRNITRIISKKVYSGDTSLVEITCDSAIEKYEITNSSTSDYQTIRYTSIDDYVTNYKAISLKGFRVREASMPDGTETRQSSILNLVAKGTSLFKALTNKESIDYRYVVDSFGLGLIERSKQQLVDICGDRLDCLGFINMPSMKSFKNSTSPSFVDSEEVLQTSFIAQGGDLESSPSFLYSFGDGRGSSCVGYFLPYVTVNDNGRPIDVPPAMYVATTYMRKQNANVTSIVPWTIAAGITNGKVTNIAGTEMNFTPTDIENLNQAQMNPIVYKRNRGYIIETENTAQTLYKSALSYLHVREVLIELERELSAMLLEFHWKFNTADVRAEIKLRADVICEKYVNKNGLYNYFNKCDEENNTSEIIDNQIGVLDSYCEPIKGMSVIVNNITILRTGAIQAGGFINQ